MSTVQEESAQEAPATFESWVAARGPALQRFAYVVTGSAADAPDLVQEALAHAYPRWKQLSRTDTVEACVRRSIVNASISRWRKEGLDDGVQRSRLTSENCAPLVAEPPTVRMSLPGAVFEVCGDIDWLR